MKTYLTASIIFHLLLLLVMVISFSNKTMIVLGKPTSRLINSYINKTDFLQTQDEHQQVQEKLKIEKTKVNIEHKKLALKKSEEKKRLNKENKLRHINQASGVRHGENTKELVALLHASIQAHQHYPDSAMEMERQGKTTVAFILLPNGMVHRLHVIHSSGTTSLDEAALEAIRDAMPFNNIKQYLTEAREFSIDVVFELS